MGATCRDVFTHAQLTPSDAIDRAPDSWIQTARIAVIANVADGRLDLDPSLFASQHGAAVDRETARCDHATDRRGPGKELGFAGGDKLHYDGFSVARVEWRNDSFV